MPLRVAVQMDPLETINISGDSTFALMLKAQELGHRLYHYLAEDLTYQRRPALCRGARGHGSRPLQAIIFASTTSPSWISAATSMSS